MAAIYTGFTEFDSSRAYGLKEYWENLIIGKQVTYEDGHLETYKSVEVHPVENKDTFNVIVRTDKNVVFDILKAIGMDKKLKKIYDSQL